MENIFYYSYRKQAIKPFACAISIVIAGIFNHFLSTWIAPNLKIISYFLYLGSIYLVFVSIWFAVRPSNKYLILTESNFKILTEKDCIDIPRSQISSVELCQSPIEYRGLPNVKYLILRDYQKVLKLSLKSFCFDNIKDRKYYKYDTENMFISSEFAYINYDRCEVYLRLAPVEGFDLLLKLLTD